MLNLRKAVGHGVLVIPYYGQVQAQFKNWRRTYVLQNEAYPEPDAIIDAIVDFCSAISPQRIQGLWKIAELVDFTTKEVDDLSLYFQNLELEIYELHENEKEILDSLDEEDREIEDKDEIECVECASVPIVVPKAPTPTPEVINKKVKKLQKQ